MAYNYLDNLKHIDKNNALIDWLKALIDYGKADYKECLKSLKQVLSTQPRCPPQVRYGIGLCYYNLGNYTKARIAFQRLLEIEPNHSLAHAGLAIIELQTKARA